MPETYSSGIKRQNKTNKQQTQLSGNNKPQGEVNIKLRILSCSKCVWGPSPQSGEGNGGDSCGVWSVKRNREAPS